MGGEQKTVCLVTKDAKYPILLLLLFLLLFLLLLLLLLLLLP